MKFLKVTPATVNNNGGGGGGGIEMPSALQHDHAYDSGHFVTRIFMAVLSHL